MATAEEEFLASKSYEDIKETTKTSISSSSKKTITKMVSKTTKSLESSMSSKMATSAITMDKSLCSEGSVMLEGGEKLSEIVKTSKTKGKKQKEKKIVEKSLSREESMIENQKEILSETQKIEDKAVMEGPAIQKKIRKSSLKSSSLSSATIAGSAISIDTHEAILEEKSHLKSVKKATTSITATVGTAVTSPNADELINGGEGKASPSPNTTKECETEQIEHGMQTEIESSTKLSNKNKKSSNTKKTTAVSLLPSAIKGLKELFFILQNEWKGITICHTNGLFLMFPFTYWWSCLKSNMICEVKHATVLSTSV